MSHYADPNDEEQLELPLNEAVSQWRDELGGVAVDELDTHDRCKNLLVRLTDTFEHLQQQGRRARACILDDEQLPARYLEPYPHEGEAARALAADAITEWYFADGQDPAETTIHIAAIATSERTREVLRDLNDAKQAFHEVVGELRQSVDSTRQEYGELYRLVTFALGRRPKVLKEKQIGQSIREIVHPRLNVRQATRVVPIIEPMPASIRWRWVPDRASDRITRAEALRMLEKYGDHPMARADQRRLAALPEDEPLSITKREVIQLRAAFTYPPGRRDKGAYSYLKTRMPIFYDGHDALGYRSEPDLTRVPDNAPRHKRRKRLEDEPYLQTLSVYRYRESARCNVEAGHDTHAGGEAAAR